MIELEQSANCYRLRSGAWEFSYRFVADRWQHVVAVRLDNAWCPLMTSEEGRPDDAILSSPAFQDLRFERPRDGVFEFQLMGQSGKGVYSGAVRFDETDRTLDFDLCSRGPIADIPLCVSTAYRLAGREALAVARHDDGTAVLTADSCHSIRIQPVSLAGCPLSECRFVEDRGDRRLIAGCFRLAEVDGSDRRPTSIRWRYRMMFGKSPGTPCDAVVSHHP